MQKEGAFLWQAALKMILLAQSPDPPICAGVYCIKTFIVIADIEKQEEGCTSRMGKIRLDSQQIELQETTGEIEANSITMYHNNSKNPMCNAMKEAI